MTGGEFTQWGFELHAEPENRENGYITWVGGGREAWTLRNSAIGPNARVDVGQRLIPEEPMAMVSFSDPCLKDLNRTIWKDEAGRERCLEALPLLAPVILARPPDHDSLSRSLVMNYVNDRS